MKKHPGGRPTDYSQEKVEIAKKYIKNCVSDDNIPYIEELAYMLDITSETVRQWAKDEKNKPEFSLTIKKLEDVQKFMLQKGSAVNKFNPASCIFQLKANHGMIETEKRILAGDKDEPIRYQNLDDEQLDAAIRQKTEEVGID